MLTIRGLLSRLLLATGRAAPDLPASHLAIIKRVKPYTVTSRERLAAVLSAVDYLSQAGMPGDIVECGVWQGGSMMAAALRLLELGDKSRSLYLYDTYDGMSEPTSRDLDLTGRPAQVGIARAGLELVQRNVASTGWPIERVHFVHGKVEDTIPKTIPAEIALLRLDTDWYESTRHELTYLYPRLVHGGILIIDDYGHWRGAREATDEFFRDTPVYLHRIDYTGRLLVKPVR